MRLSPVALTLPLLVALSCALPDFRIEGSGEDFARFAGRWEGIYSSDESGRAGTVVFSVRQDGSQARGEIIMVPRGWGKPLGAAAQRPAGERPDLLHALHFRLMRLEGDRVSGTLEPYRDPDCGCDLETSFEGKLSNDVIVGTYRSRALEGEETTGEEVMAGIWKVKKTK